MTQKGEIALRGGILDVYPLTSPWPVRLEFFGDELESLRQFDPLTQMSREEITAVTIPPAGELGLLKKSGAECRRVPSPNPQSLWGRCWTICRRKRSFCCASRSNWPSAQTNTPRQVPEGDPFFIPWEAFQEQAGARDDPAWK